MIVEKGYIKIKGTINGLDFTKTLVPVKGSPYRLFVNAKMMKEGETSLGSIAKFTIEQDSTKVNKQYPTPGLLKELLRENKLTANYNNLSASRKKDILKYLSYVKTEATLKKNIDKLIVQLNNNEMNVRIP